MSAATELRASQRVPISNRTQIMKKGRVVAYAIAINISMGGVLLQATQGLQAGSTCQLELLQGEGGRLLSTEGIVVRSDTNGTAIRFAQPLATEAYESILKTAAPSGASFLQSFRDYYQVSKDPLHSQSEQLLGVSPKVFKTVFLTTFSASIPLAIVPIWLAKALIPDYSNVVKILLAFCYGGLWMLVLQPLMDISVFRFLRKREPSHSKA